VQCPGGGTPPIAWASQDLVACDAVEYDCEAGSANSNIVMFRDDFVDEPEGLRFGVIALTTLTANRRTGEIFDADIEINSRDETFTHGGSSSGDPSAARDLRGVVHHELGHLLGLSHSRVPGALMRAAYEATTAPSADDIAAICQAWGSDPKDPQCATEPPPDGGVCLGADVSCTTQTQAPAQDGCSCYLAVRQGPPTGAWGGVAILILGASLLRSRRGETVL